MHWYFCIRFWFSYLVFQTCKWFIVQFFIIQYFTDGHVFASAFFKNDKVTGTSNSLPASSSKPQASKGKGLATSHNSVKHNDDSVAYLRFVFFRCHLSSYKLSLKHFPAPLEHSLRFCYILTVVLLWPVYCELPYFVYTLLLHIASLSSDCKYY